MFMYEMVWIVQLVMLSLFYFPGASDQPSQGQINRIACFCHLIRDFDRVGQSREELLQNFSPHLLCPDRGAIARTIGNTRQITNFAVRDQEGATITHRFRELPQDGFQASNLTFRLSPNPMLHSAALCRTVRRLCGSAPPHSAEIGKKISMSQKA